MKNPDDELNEESTTPEDYEVREYVEKLPGYQEHLRELRGDSLTFGDW